MSDDGAPQLNVEPAYYYDQENGGGIPVFCPTMDQFKDFIGFVEAINEYGMASGIVKIIPPAEWRATLPDLSDKLGSVKVKKPIVQHILGCQGIYTQTNVEKRRFYSLQQWHDICEHSDHRPPGKKEPKAQSPPAKRRKKNVKADLIGTETPSLDTKASPKMEHSDPEISTKRDQTSSVGLKVISANGPVSILNPVSPTGSLPNANASQSAHTPFSPTYGSLPTPPREEVLHATNSSQPDIKSEAENSTSEEAATAEISEEPDSKMANEADTDDVAPINFNYHCEDDEKYTVEYCKDVERYYWRNLTFNQPMYGADMCGTLFGDDKRSWNVNQLDNLLNNMGVKLPGVNTPYLYFGMWKATFAWHVEDMDLYSINYLHFGAPKQWYAIPSANRGRFETLMQNIFYEDYRHCHQFLRHKTFLVSPNVLSKNSIPFNRLVQHEGEFVITFPFGYHSGYNLGFNCAESVNFALDSWLPIGKEANACQCIGDSVKIDVSVFDPNLGHAAESDGTPDDATLIGGLGGANAARQEADTCARMTKHNHPATGPDVDHRSVKARKMHVSSTPTAANIPVKCFLCPNPDPELPTGDGGFAHRICADVIPDTCIVSEPDGDIVLGISAVPRSRFKLRCQLCGQTKGACIQCCKGKCTRSFHGTCIQKAGLKLEKEVFEDGSVLYEVICPTHDPDIIAKKEVKQEESAKMYREKMQAKTPVWGRIPGGQYYEGVILDVLPKRSSCKILFSDGYKKVIAYDDMVFSQPPTPEKDDEEVEDGGQATQIEQKPKVRQTRRSLGSSPEDGQSQSDRQSQALTKEVGPAPPQSSQLPSPKAIDCEPSPLSSAEEVLSTRATPLPSSIGDVNSIVPL